MSPWPSVIAFAALELLTWAVPRDERCKRLNGAPDVVECRIDNVLYLCSSRTCERITSIDRPCR